MKLSKTLMTCAIAFSLTGSLFAEAENAQMETKTIKGESAEQMIEAFQNSKLPQTDILVSNEVSYTFDSITCKQVVYPGAKASCTILHKGHAMGLASAEDGTNIFRILQENGGRVRTGLGVRKVLASDIQCSRPFAFPAEALCTFKVMKRSN